MSELREYRQQMIERYQQVSDEFSAACRQITAVYQPVPGSDWNLHQIAIHVVVVQSQVYGARARRTVQEQEPLFQSFDADTWMAEHYDPHTPIGQMLTEFDSEISAFVSWMQELPTEAWSRESSHETLGSGFTTQTWVERGLAHIEEHLAAARST